MATRKKISDALASEIKLKNRWMCCVCRTRRMRQIHHIDKNNSNTIFENLAALCLECHNEAHSDHQLSRNLTPEDIRLAKVEWEAAAAEQMTTYMLPESHSEFAIWSFINLERLPMLAHTLGVRVSDDVYIDTAYNNGLISELLIPGEFTEPRRDEDYSFPTIWKRYDHRSAQLLHYAYCQVVNGLVRAAQPLDLETIWSKSEFEQFATPGSLVYCSRGFWFRSLDKRKNISPTRHFLTRARKLGVRGIANTEYFYGSSALHSDYSGHKRVAMLGIAKSLMREDDVMYLDITPIAFGVGFFNRLPSTKLHKTLKAFDELDN